MRTTGGNERLGKHLSKAGDEPGSLWKTRRREGERNDEASRIVRDFFQPAQQTFILPQEVQRQWAGARIRFQSAGESSDAIQVMAMGDKGQSKHRIPVLCLKGLAPEARERRPSGPPAAGG